MDLTEAAPLNAAAHSIAFYLPQYHAIPENDAWWGAGFTDWKNVSQASSRFPGHIQPHVPGELGAYDPRLSEVRERQAALASNHGVSAFCFYHYWFNGRRVLEQPVDLMLKSRAPDFPFMLCWANENWTRRWDGKESEVLLHQDYGLTDDRAHIQSLLPVFGDSRYVTLGGRPVFLVYRATLFPNSVATTDAWREEVVRAGLPEPFIVRVESARAERGDPRTLGFDAAVDFQPHLFTYTRAVRAQMRGVAKRMKLTAEPVPKDTRRSYEKYVATQLASSAPRYPRFPGVSPGWDNTARRKRGATIFHGSTPALYENWVRSVVEGPLLSAAPAKALFVNAWNEWAEGAHLEPDLHWGRAYIEAHASGLGVSVSRDEYSKV